MKVVLFLNGGGVCWDATSCAFTGDQSENDFYDWSLANTDPGNRTGIFDTTQVVVVGKTAGSIAAPVYGGLVADRLPTAKVIVFGGQSGAWPDSTAFATEILDGQWGARDFGPTVPRFWVQAGLRHPGLVLARFDFAYDPHAAPEVTRWMTGSLLETIDRNEAAIEAAGVPLHSCTAPGAEHQIFETDELFYGTDVSGVRLVDWLRQLITGDPPADVHCADCGP
ncbi:hypothetical protein [Actinoplanes sp. NPDC026619]|uniref:hypothetical protein n=1 Tax=Actinoplanes sp. NPDC026619 TaxID=3155798 RepID=UPI0033C7F5E4